MPLADNPRLPLTSGKSPITKYTEMSDANPSSATSIAMNSMASSSEPVRRQNNSVRYNECDLRGMPTRQRRVVKKTLMANVGYRLGKRKVLHIRRRLIGDLMCFLGMFGIVLMIIECELTFQRIDHKETTLSLLLKATITFTTIILVGLVYYYHRIDLTLYCVDNSIDDWRIVLTRKKMFLIILEAFICLVHPIPGHFIMEWSSQYVKTVENGIDFMNPYPSGVFNPTGAENSTSMPMFPSTNSTNSAQAHVPIDVMLSIPMFFRLYLVCRLLMLRSHLVRDASSQSLGYLNRVSFTFPFILKAYIQQEPAECLTTFCITTFLIASWSMRACEYSDKTGHMSMLDSTWLFVISFTTIGYGDIVPSTYCGRGIAALTGIVGVFSTALLVAVISQKLELTRSEKYVHNFVASIVYSKSYKDQAANVVKYGWKVWYLKRQNKQAMIQYIQAQRKLLTSIHYLRKIKQQQRKLTDNCISLLELYDLQSGASKSTIDTSEKVQAIESKINKMEDTLTEVNQEMITLQDKMNILLDRIPQR